MKKKIIILVIVIIAAAVIAVLLGYFPVASVYGEVILYRDLDKLTGAYETYSNIIKERNPEFLGVKDAGTDTRRALLEELIVREIIFSGGDELDKAGVDSKVEEDMNKALSSAEKSKLKEAARVLYGLSYGAFISRILEPEAREIVVREKVEENGLDYADWLDERVNNASPRIFFLPYKWSSGHLEAK